MDLVLASQSPRRSELLRVAGFSFMVRSRPVEEVRGRGDSPLDYAMRLARAKAEAAWIDSNEPGGKKVVLGADTIVVLGDVVLEKPADAGDARRMLEALSGRSHTVITGICLRHRRGAIVDSESTEVHFSALHRGKSTPMSPAASPWIRPAHTGFKAWPRSSSTASRVVTLTSWGCRWRDFTGIGNHWNRVHNIPILSCI